MGRLSSLAPPDISFLSSDVVYLGEQLDILNTQMESMNTSQEDFENEMRKEVRGIPTDLIALRTQVMNFYTGFQLI